MLREKSKWRTHEDESTDAEHRGGLPRISDEASEMKKGNNVGAKVKNLRLKFLKR